jgi:hypothetical protein
MTGGSPLKKPSISFYKNSYLTACPKFINEISERRCPKAIVC